jgi:uncharacterized protein (DUF433 family)
MGMTMRRATVETATHSLVGVGLYTVPEAARLTRVPPAKIRGWINGYGGRAKNDRASIIHRQIPVIAGKSALGFLDLIEVRFVSWLVGNGVSWQTIRTAADRAREELHHEHPFALARFHTDGKVIFLETQEKTGDRKLLDLTKNNFAMYEVLEQSFRDGIAFGTDGEASSWRPPDGDKTIILDPRRSFGRPIDDVSGVPTATLADAYRAEGSFDRVASWFEVPPEAVRRAVTYEMKLAA